jgi:DeoR/GlpR family transcriptional regulator of sugar metabolism
MKQNFTLLHIQQRIHPILPDFLLYSERFRIRPRVLPMRRSPYLLEAERRPGRLPTGVRRARLAEIVGRTGFISIADVADRLGVSGMTIRRDLALLAMQGVLTRTHGGAVAARREVFDAEEPSFERRRRRNADAKARIAGAAAKLIGPNETVALDVGTSTLALAEVLAARADLRVFTNSLRAAVALTGSRSPVYLLGGQLRGSELAVIGPVATAQVRDYVFDRVFLGVSGMTESGFYDYALEDSEVKRAFIERADQVVVLCDASKFGHRSLAQICGLDRCHVLVTDAPPPDHLAHALRDSGTTTVVAGS